MFDDRLHKALKDVISANDEFRRGLPPNWDGDQVDDACNDAKRLLAEIDGDRRAWSDDDPTVEIAGRPFMNDARGRLVPVETIKPADKLMDQAVRKIIAFARDLSGQIGRFRGHTFEDVNTLLSLIAEQYGAKLGGRKGNVTLTSFDGCLKVQVQVAEQLTFGPELQAAKKLIDSCLVEWGAESRPELRAVVERAFSVGKEGKVDSASLFSLLRLEIADDRWVAAMNAIRESIRVIGSKEYVRFYERDRPEGQWRAITVDVANA
jgi:hypothetical protein